MGYNSEEAHPTLAFKTNGKPMNRLAVQLDEKLRSLDPNRAQYLEFLVREALDRAEQGKRCPPVSEWPAEYFQQTSGVLTGENFERPSQGEFPDRDEW